MLPSLYIAHEFLNSLWAILETKIGELKMADITICDSLVCPKRLQCYRWVAKPDKLQSYSRFPDCDAEHDYMAFIKASDQEINDYLRREGLIDG